MGLVGRLLSKIRRRRVSMVFPLSKEDEIRSVALRLLRDDHRGGQQAPSGPHRPEAK